MRVPVSCCLVTKCADDNLRMQWQTLHARNFIEKRIPVSHPMLGGIRKRRSAFCVITGSKA